MKKSYSGEIEYQDGQQYTSELISFNENVVNDVKDSAINNLKRFKVFPSLETWITPRSDVKDDYRILNDTARVVLPTDTENIFKLELRALDSSDNYQVVDITDNIVSKEQYQLLANTEQEKGRVLIFDQYSNIIFGLSDQPIRGFKPAFPAMRTILQEKGLKLNQDYKDLQFRVYYNEMFNTAESSVRYEDDESFKNNYATLINQGNNVISSEKLSSNKQAKLNKLGNVELKRSYISKSFFDKPNVGDVLEYNGKRYYANIVAWELYPTFIRYDVSYTKDFNRLNEFIGVDRETRAFELPTKNIQDRHTYLNEYLLFSKNQYEVGQGSTNTIVGEKGHFTNNGIISTITPLIHRSNRIQITNNPASPYKIVTANNVCFDTGSYLNKTTQQDGITHSKLAMPTIKFPISNGIGFGINFNSNISAGLSGDNIVSIVNKEGEPAQPTNVSQEILYTRSGFMDYFEGINIVSTIEPLPAATDADIMKIAKTLPKRIDVNGVEQVVKGVSIVDFNEDRINLLKDSREIPKFAYFKQFVTDSKLYITDYCRNLSPILFGELEDGFEPAIHFSYDNIENYQTRYNTNNGKTPIATINNRPVYFGYTPLRINNTLSNPVEGILKMQPVNGIDFNFNETAEAGKEFKAIVVTDSNNNTLFYINDAFGETGIANITQVELQQYGTFYIHSLDNEYRQ